MTPDMKVPAPHGNGERAEQSPSEDSVAFNVPLTHQQRERAQRRTRLRSEAQARRASRELDAIIADWEVSTTVGRFVPSDRWTRNFGNQLVRQGFDPEYVAHRYGLTRRTRVAA